MNADVFIVALSYIGRKTLLIGNFYFSEYSTMNAYISDCECPADRNCLVVCSDSDFILSLNQIVMIKIKINQSKNIQKYSIVEIKHHLCNKPWIVGTNYVYYNSEIGLQIPIVGAEPNTRIPSHEPLCHLKIITPEQVITNIKGKLLHFRKKFFGFVCFTNNIFLL
jgi:hypothetical protein